MELGNPVVNDSASTATDNSTTNANPKGSAVANHDDGLSNYEDLSITFDKTAATDSDLSSAYDPAIHSADTDGLSDISDPSTINSNDNLSGFNNNAATNNDDTSLSGLGLSASSNAPSTSSKSGATLNSSVLVSLVTLVATSVVCLGF